MKVTDSSKLLSLRVKLSIEGAPTLERRFTKQAVAPDLVIITYSDRDAYASVELSGHVLKKDGSAAVSRATERLMRGDSPPDWVARLVEENRPEWSPR